MEEVKNYYAGSQKLLCRKSKIIMQEGREVQGKSGTGIKNNIHHYLGKFEQHAIEHAPFKPHIGFRYIDDIFMIWTEGQDNLKTFLNYINSIHPTIKFTHEYSNSPNQTLPFLDVQVHLNNNQIQNDLHTKPTDKHQYYSRHLVTPPTPNVPSLSASPCVYVASARPTISSINAVVNSLTQFLELRGYSAWPLS